jgi:hypothetical protein
MIKPSPWAVDPALVDSRFRGLWDGLICCYPIWGDDSVAGGCRDVGPLRLANGVVVGGVNTPYFNGNALYASGQNYISAPATIEQCDGMTVMVGSKLERTGTFGAILSVVGGGTANKPFRIGWGNETGTVSVDSITNDPYDQDFVALDDSGLDRNNYHIWTGEIGFGRKAFWQDTELLYEDTAITGVLYPYAGRYPSSGWMSDGISDYGYRTFMYCWNRPLTDAERALLVADPFGLVRPTRIIPSVNPEPHSKIFRPAGNDGIKPGEWAVDPALVAEPHRRLWQDLQVAAVFWDTNGSVFTEVAQGLQGDFYGSAIGAMGPTEHGLALLRDNATGRAQIDHSDKLNLVKNEATLFAFAAPDQINAVRSLIRKSNVNDTYVLRVINLGQVQFGMNTTTVASGTSTLTAGKPTAMAGVWDGAEMRVYIDGVQKNQVARAGAADNGTDDLWFGGRPTDNAFDGPIWVAYVWNRALSNEEIIQLSENPFGPIRPARTTPKALPPSHSRIFRPAASDGIKPSPWAVDPALVEPEWRWFWSDFEPDIMLPLSGGAGSPTNLGALGNLPSVGSGVTWGVGLNGAVLDYDGTTNAFVELPAGIYPPNHQLTLLARVKFSDVTSKQSILAWGYDWAADKGVVFQVEASYFQSYIGAEKGVTSITASIGVWYNAVVTYDLSTGDVSAWINEGVQLTGVANGTPSSFGSQFALGASNNSGGLSLKSGSQVALAAVIPGVRWDSVQARAWIEDPFGLIRPARMFPSPVTTAITVTDLEETLEGFRWVNDDDVEASATFAEVQDVKTTVDVDGTIRLRIVIQGPLGGPYQIEGRIKTTGTYAKIRRPGP